MSALTWDESGKRLYETGVRNGVLYVWDEEANAFAKGVAWNGLTGVTESPSGADSTALYADDIKYLELRSAEEFGGTIEAYTYPDAFCECNGEAAALQGVYLGQQARKKFCFVYKTVLGNDEDLDSHGYKLHIVYNATVSPSERAYQTINDSPEAITFSWEFSTVGATCTNYKPVSLLTIDSTQVTKTKLEALEKMLFGDTSSEPTIKMPDEVLAALQ